MSVDLRDFAMIRPLSVERFSAPQLGTNAWTYPIGSAVPRALGRASEPMGWGLPTVAPNEVEHGVTPAALGAELPSMEQLSEWWSNLAADLHKAVYRRGTQIVTGVAIPEEASSPTKARDYLATLLDQQATLRGWPAQSAQYAAAIRTMAPSGTVVATVDRAIALGGPPQEWPGAAGWYAVAAQLQKSAALLSAGEAAGLIQRVPGKLAEGARAYAAEARPIIERGLDVAQELNRNIGTGIGLGAGLGAAAVVAAGMLTVGAVGAWFFSPELAVGARTIYAAKTIKDRRRKTK